MIDPMNHLVVSLNTINNVINNEKDNPDPAILLVDMELTWAHEALYHLQKDFIALLDIAEALHDNAEIDSLNESEEDNPELHANMKTAEKLFRRYAAMPWTKLNTPKH